MKKGQKEDFNMKYNIITVASRKYVPYLDILLSSFLEKGNVEDLNTFYIVDIDLGEYKDILPTHPKFKYIETHKKDNYTEVHSAGWYNNTSEKTLQLLKILPTLSDPLILIDCDVAIEKDISQLIDLKKDIQITYMSEGSHKAGTGIQIWNIACFMIFNNIEKSCSFVKLWRSIMQRMAKQGFTKPHETPSLNILLSLYDKNLEKCSYQNEKVFYNLNINELLTINGGLSSILNVDYIPSDLSCADQKLFPKSYSIHFKSNGNLKNKSILENVRDRIHQSGLGYERYISKEIYLKWATEYE